jgi:hypothetical protein
MRLSLLALMKASGGGALELVQPLLLPELVVVRAGCSAARRHLEFGGRTIFTPVERTSTTPVDSMLSFTHFIAVPGAGEARQAKP